MSLDTTPHSPADRGAETGHGHDRRNQDRRREEVLAAAAECFMRRGYEATSMDHVAEALGATKGRVYHHFRSKPDLFFAVYRRAMDINMQAVAPHAEGPGTGRERLTRMAEAHTLAMMESQPFQRTLTMGADLWRFGGAQEHAATLDDLIALRHIYEGLFRGVVDQGLADGSLAVPDAPLAVKTLLGALNWVTVWYSKRPNETRAQRLELAEILTRTVLGGFEP
ncbi:MAG: TetR/AcrR family transcriptional regulator [Alphaproteobacteria bacterium]